MLEWVIPAHINIFQCAHACNDAADSRKITENGKNLPLILCLVLSSLNQFNTTEGIRNLVLSLQCTKCI